jgi:hypothetical protein
MDFVFDNFAVFASLQAGVAVLLIFAGRGLLLLQRWAARVIEGVAWLVLVYAVVFTGYFAYELFTAMSEAPQSANPVAFMVMMSIFMAFTLAFWGVPLVLAIRSLRSERVRGILA